MLGLALLSTGLSSPAAAMTAKEYFEDGNRLFRDDLYWAALLRYRQANETGLNTPILHYNMGVAHYRAGQYIRARESLLIAIDSPALRIAAQYNLGLNAYADDELDEAVKWFTLVRDQQENRKLSKYARVAIGRIRKAQIVDDPIVIEAKKRQKERELTNLELRARVSFGNDSNVFRTPNQDYIDLSDPNQPLVQPVVQAGAFIPVSLSAKYQVNAYENEGFFGAYRLAGRFYQDKELKNGNEYLHELSFGNEYRRKNEDTGRSRRVYSAFRFAQHDEVYYDPDNGGSVIVDGVALDDRFDYTRYGPEITFRETWNLFSLGFKGKGQLWNYKRAEGVPEYDHEYIMAGMYAQLNFTPTSLLRVAGDWSTRRFGDRRARDLDGTIDIDNELLRYDYVDASVTARQRITRGMWFGVEYQRRERVDEYLGYADYTRNSYGGEFHWNVGTRVDIEASGYYRLYDFPNAFAFNTPAGGPKTLESIDANIIGSYRMTRSLYLVFEASIIERASSDPRLQYDRNQYVIGVRWEP